MSDQPEEGERYDAPNQQAIGQPHPSVEGTGGGEGEPQPTPTAQQDGEQIEGEEPEGDGLDTLTKDELLQQAQAMGVTPANAGMSKQELIDGIRAAGGGA